MKVCSTKDIKAITGIMAASLLLGGCTSVKPKTTTVELKGDPQIKAAINFKEVADTEYDEDQMDAAYRKYCVEIFSQTVRDYGTKDNIMISPASIMMALDMVAAGAKGDSLDQLTNLFAAGQGPLTQQAYAAALMDKINSAKDIDFTCANSVWSNAALLGDTINMDYVEYIQDTFLSEYKVAEFSDDTVDEINAWIDENTNHMIDRAIDKLEPTTVMVLVNAIAFEAKWANAYEDYQIREDEFHAANGSTQNVTFLNDTTGIYYETDKATGFIKYYKGGDYAFLAILPTDESINANDFAADFTAEDYEAFINSETSEYEVYSKMPEFTSDFSYLANDTLENLGVTDIFHAQTADLSGIAGAPGDLYVTKVIHKTHIEVDRSGTKAAAVTVVTLDAASCEPMEVETREVYCDRPFVYAIVDVETMAPVFIGTVNEV
ncbi:serpin B [Ruminococcaceae bacterium YAD3003]|nr:serpin B [Ruminococcaceae bacterium YAD3003]